MDVQVNQAEQACQNESFHSHLNLGPISFFRIRDNRGISTGAAELIIHLTLDMVKHRT